MVSANKQLVKKIDERWIEQFQHVLWSYKNDDGTREFFTSKMACEKISHGLNKPVESYCCFAPSELINRVSGHLPINHHKTDKEIMIYVDGSYSYRPKVATAAYGIFMEVDDYCAEYANYIHDEYNYYGPFGAELISSILAIKIALAHGYTNIHLCYDFEGIEIFYHTEDFSKITCRMQWLGYQYKTFFECLDDNVNITFEHIQGHSLNIGNEHADFLASKFAIIGYRKMMDINKLHIEEVQGHRWIETFNDMTKLNIDLNDIKALIQDENETKKHHFDKMQKRILLSFITGISHRQICQEYNLSKSQVRKTKKTIMQNLSISHTDNPKQIALSILCRLYGKDLSIIEEYYQKDR